jgi:hypothetical protein
LQEWTDQACSRGAERLTIATQHIMLRPGDADVRVLLMNLLDSIRTCGLGAIQIALDTSCFGPRVPARAQDIES